MITSVLIFLGGLIITIIYYNKPLNTENRVLYTAIGIIILMIGVGMFIISFVVINSPKHENVINQEISQQLQQQLSIIEYEERL